MSSSGVKVRPASAFTPNTRKKSPLTYSPSAYRASPDGERLKRAALHAITPEKACCSLRISSYWADVSRALRVENQPARMESFSKSIETSSRGFWTGSVRRRIASTSSKIAVFAPMPNASDATATTANPGLFLSCRSP